MTGWSELPPLQMSRYMYAAMRSWVRVNAPEEACGILSADATGMVRRHLSMENVLHSPVRYRMDPQSQFEEMMQIERSGLMMLAIYHSHPQGPPFPSHTDVNEAFYPDTYSLIWYFDQNRWQLSAFLIRDGQYQPVPIQIR